MEAVLTQPMKMESKGNTKKLTYGVIDQNFDLNTAYRVLYNDIIIIVKKNIIRTTKFRIAFVVNFIKTNYETGNIIRHNNFKLWGQLDLINNHDNFNNVLYKQWEKISQEEDKFTENGSGWTIDSVNEVIIEFYGYSQLRGSGTFKELPTKLANKRACVNVKNQDLKCFKWAVLSCLFSADRNPDRLSHYKKYENNLNDKDLTYPVDVKDVQKFADKNNLVINVFGWENDLLTIYHTDDKIYKVDYPVVNLLLYNLHYVWIKHISALMYDQTKGCAKKYTCLKCLNHHKTQATLDMHIKTCIQLHDGESSIEMPKLGSKTQFKNIKNMLKVPYVVYTDFESVIAPTHKEFGKGSLQTGYHQASSYYVACIRSDGKCIYTNLYRGLSVMANFTCDLNNIYAKILSIPPKEMIITPYQQSDFEKTTQCYLCTRSFTKYDVKVRDHDHITGYYRGAAHNSCNLRLKPNKKIPVIIHNFRGYDSHLIIKELAQDANVIANNKEKFMTMSIGAFKFIDSMQFLNSSLDKLAESLGDNDLKYIRMLADSQQAEPEARIALLKRKGVFPYEYLNSFDRYNDTFLPPIEAFKSSLDGFKGIKEDDYQHAKNVWNTFNIQNMGEYSDLYLKTDVMLLADVFETFRKLSLDVYKLDPCNYISLPSLAWDALLLKTKIVLDNITNVNMYNFVEKGIRGGISTTGSLRYHKANNKYVKDYDPTKPSTFIMYEDMNNLYGWAMKKPLPTGGFRWIKTVDELKSGEGYMAEVDLEYPQRLHDHHNDFPFAAEHVGGKLIPTLNNKYNYVVHHEALEQMFNHGLKVTKVHNILAFKESNWMEPYIDMNTDLRKNAKTDFEKDFYKLMNNAVFGKSMENVRNRIDVRLISCNEKYDKIKKNPRFRCDKLINDNLAAVLLTKSKCVLNKPIYVGQAILDISKTLMYQYWYDNLKLKFVDKIRLMYTDTDSFIFGVECEDYFKTINCNDYDISNFQQEVRDQVSGWEANKKRVGIPKSETGNNIIESVIALRSKMYSVKSNYYYELDNKSGVIESNKAKGVKKYIVKKITHDDYYDCLFNDTTHICEMNMLKQSNHVIYNLTQTKVSLSNTDDKRYYIDHVNSYAHGHYKTN